VQSGSCGEFIEDLKMNDRTIAEFLEFAPVGFSLSDCTLITQVDNEDEEIVKITIRMYKYDEPRENYQNE